MESLFRACEASIECALEDRDVSLFQLLGQVCSTLTESMSGPCSTNQAYLAGSDAMGICQRAIEALSLEPDDDDEMRHDTTIRSMQAHELDPGVWGTKRRVACHLKTQVLRMVLGATEGLEPTILHHMLSNFNPAVLVAEVIETLAPHAAGELAHLSKQKPFFKSLSESLEGGLEGDSRGMEEACEEGIMAYLVLKYFERGERAVHGAPEGEIQRWLDRLDLEAPEVYSLLQRVVRSVEINWGGRPYTVYFRVPAVCLQVERKEALMEHVAHSLRDIDRDNEHKKAAGLVGQIGELVAEISHMEVILASKGLRHLITFNHTLERVPFRVALAILLLLVLFYGTKAEPFADHTWALYLVEALSFLQLGGSIFFVVTYFVVAAPIAMHKARIQTKRAEQQDRQRSTRLMNAADLTSPGPSEERAAKIVPPPPIEEPRNLVFDVLQASLISWGAWWHIAFLTLGVFAFWPDQIEWRFLYAFHMLEYFRLPEGRSILESIVVGGPGLLKSAQGGLVVILMAASVSWMYFTPNIQAFGDRCNTAYQCVTHLLNAGLKGDLSSAFGNAEIKNVFPAATYPLQIQDIVDIQAGWLFTVLFYVVWNFVLVGIVTGQIVTAFSAIRERETSLSKNEAEFCLVCSIDRFCLENAGLDFEKHTTEVHSPWSYTCFMVRLSSLGFEARNGMESYVASMLDANERGAEWIPVGMCCGVAGCDAGLETTAEAEGPQAREEQQSLEARIQGLEAGVAMLCRMIEGAGGYAGGVGPARG